MDNPEVSASVITGVGKMKNYQVSQVLFYGFRREGEDLLQLPETPDGNILKLVNYLDKERISYRLSVTATENIHGAIENRQLLNQSVDRGRWIKEKGILGKAFREFCDFALTLPRRLKDHQLKSAFHMYSLRNAANFSVPGSGKTSSVLTVYEKYRQEGLCNVLFIIGPPSCFQPWQSEFFETLGRKPVVCTLPGKRPADRKTEYIRPAHKSSELYLSTFQTAQNDVDQLVKFLSRKELKVFLVIDEAHYMKQLGGSWAASLFQMGRHAVSRVVLTGTPMPQSYRDLFNLFDFLWGENVVLDQNDKARIMNCERLGDRANARLAKVLLNEKVGPLFYRVRKKDLGLIPAVFHPPAIVEMNTTEREIYDKVNSRIQELSESEYGKSEEFLSQLWRGRMIRLRQSVSYPGLLAAAIGEPGEKAAEEDSLRYRIGHYGEMEMPAKLKALTGLVEEIRRTDRKVLIWSNFVGTLEMLRDHFTQMGLKTAIIYGKTPVRKGDETMPEDETREGIRDIFLDMESGLDILVANPAACAESISLHKTCFHAVYYDLSYNCSQYLQSLDRIHRVGGSEINRASYYFLQYADSIDQDIKQELEKKEARMNDIIDQDYTVYSLELHDTGDDDIEAYKRLMRRI